ncbi:uncharacterized protein LOC134279885 [Saccostrea cucullata]|uniref:uncharacterized protein LOC134279885 n=1 Tax=Saccostrea cuccullata TaxID=36930 RepID=UPI002ED4F6DD
MTISEQMQSNAFRNLTMLERGISLQLKTMTTTGEGSKIFSNIKLQEILVHSNRTSLIQSMSTISIPIQDCATKSTTYTFPKTTIMTSQLNDSMTMTNMVSATKITTVTMTSTPTKTATQTSATNLLTTPTMTSSKNESVKTTTQSPMNATITDCLGINRNNSEVLNSKENCDLLVTSTSEQFTVPGYVFIVVVSVLVAAIIIVLLIWRWRLRPSKYKKSETRNGNPDVSCNKNHTAAESSEGKHIGGVYENSEQTTYENEYAYKNITELEESIPKNKSHMNENFYQKLGEDETRFYEQLGENKPVQTP